MYKAKRKLGFFLEDTQPLVLHVSQLGSFWITGKMGKNRNGRKKHGKSDAPVRNLCPHHELIPLTVEGGVFTFRLAKSSFL